MAWFNSWYKRLQAQHTCAHMQTHIHTHFDFSIIPVRPSKAKISWQWVIATDWVEAPDSTNWHGPLGEAAGCQLAPTTMWSCRDVIDRPLGSNHHRHPLGCPHHQTSLAFKRQYTTHIQMYISSHSTDINQSSIQNCLYKKDIRKKQATAVKISLYLNLYVKRDFTYCELHTRTVTQSTGIWLPY